MKSVAQKSQPLEMEPPLPSNTEAERSILGAILMDNRALATAREMLEPEDFFLPQHVHIFYEMLELHGKNVAIDLVTLTEECHRAGELELVGGAAYLASLVDGMPRVSNIEHYGRITKEKAVLRNIIHATNFIQMRAFEEQESGVLLDDADRRVRELREVANGTQRGKLRTYTPAELRALVAEPIEAIVYPLAVRGMFSLLDGQAKAAGKTTLVLHAIRSILRKQSFLGRATKLVNILYVTEEFKRTFLLALGRVGLSGETSGLHIIPRDEWSGIPWPVLAEQLEQKCRQLSIGWLITDTFFTIAGLNRSDDQNDAGLVDAAAAPLRSIAGLLDVAVLTTRHERKGGGIIGESGRGSTALTGAADIVLRLQRLPGCGPNIRELEVTGRIDADCFTIELRDGNYITRTDDARTSTANENDALNAAIRAKPDSTIRELSQATGIDKSRISKVAARLGWRKAKGEHSWSQTTQQSAF